MIASRAGFSASSILETMFYYKQIVSLLWYHAGRHDSITKRGDPCVRLVKSSRFKSSVQV